MNETDYKSILEAALVKLGLLRVQQENIETEISKQREFVLATWNMLSEQESGEFKARMGEALKNDRANETSLTESVRLVLKSADGTLLTAVEVRDKLFSSGFDFSRYLSNPLSSVSTTLRRLTPEEVESVSVRGVAAYRWRGDTNAEPAAPSILVAKPASIDTGRKVMKR